MSSRIVPLPARAATLRDDLERAWSRGIVPLLLPEDATGPPSSVGALDRPIPDDAALVMLTSGSSGAPRGVVLTHRGIDASVRSTNERLGCRAGDRWALALPVHHVAGLMVVLRAHALGTEPVDLAEADSAHVALVPTQLGRLLDAGVDPRRFATLLIGGGPDPGGHIERARSIGGRVIASYGMTETCGGCVHDGVPLPGVEVEIDEQGRIRIRGAVLAAGYLGAGAGPQDDGGFRDGWFVTGDRGRMEADRLVVEGRADDVLVTGGVNVPAVAVERALLLHPAVADATVVGVTDPDWGQRVRAVIVPSDADAPPRLEGLRRHVRTTLPATHAPTELVLVDHIPRDRMEKVSASTRLALARRPPDERHGTSGTRTG